MAKALKYKGYFIHFTSDNYYLVSKTKEKKKLFKLNK
jgi:hypothetical protein